MICHFAMACKIWVKPTNYQCFHQQLTDNQPKSSRNLIASILDCWECALLMSSNQYSGIVLFLNQILTLSFVHLYGMVTQT